MDCYLCENAISDEDQEEDEVQYIGSGTSRPAHALCYWDWMAGKEFPKQENPQG